MMFDRITARSVLLLTVVYSCTACSADKHNGDWELADELIDAGDATDVVDDVRIAQPDAQSDDQPDISPAPDADAGPEAPRCPRAEIAFPAETLPAVELPDPLGEVPHMVWNRHMENYDGVRATPNGPLGVARGMVYNRESADKLVAPGYIPATGEEPDYSFSFEIDAGDGTSMGASGRGGSSDGFESQVHDLPAPMLFPEQDMTVLISATQPTEDGPYTDLRTTLTIGISADSEVLDGASSVGYEAPGRGTIPLLSDVVVLPRGLGVLLWDGRMVLGLPKRMFNPDPDYFPHPPYRAWTINLGQLWPDAPDGTELTWLKSPSADETLVLARHTPAEGVQPEADRLFRIDPCGNHELVFSGAGIASELLEVGDQYLIRIGSREESAAGSTPVLVSGGRKSASLEADCRDIVQTEAGRFACLAQKPHGAGFEVVHFDDTLERIDSQPLDTGYSYARLWSAADNGALVLLGLRGQDDQTPVVDLLLVYPDDTVRYELPEAQDWEPAADDIDRAWPVLTQRGIVALMWGTSVFGIQTDLPGMAHTPYPRAYYGGNHNRGFVDVAN